MAFRSWDWVVEAVGRFLEKPARVQHLLEKLPAEASPGERRRSQYLLYGVVRHKSLLEKVLSEFLSRTPKREVEAGLMIASFELMSEPEKGPLIVDHAVTRIGHGQGGRGAKGLANAVLRKVAKRLPELLAESPTNVEGLSWRYSHPRWLVEKWMERFGLEKTKNLLEWNLREPDVFFFPIGDYEVDSRNEAFERLAESGYWKLKRGDWKALEPLLASGRAYAQNPASGIAPRMLVESISSGRILDLCSAPGGKAIALDQLCGEGLESIVSVVPGQRFDRLRSNLDRCAKRVSAVEGDLFSLDPAMLGTFEGVLLDAPCSNLGVLQRKLDVKWRVSPRSLEALPPQQGEFLEAASRFVSPEGRLIYSLCSFDETEGRDVVDRFLASDAGRSFRLERSEIRYPGEMDTDGAAVFELIRFGSNSPSLATS